MSFSLLLSTLPRATFPSYDLCFPALPEKKGGTGRGGGTPFRLAVLRWGWGRKSEWYLVSICSGLGHQLMWRSQVWPLEVGAPSPRWNLVTSRVTSRLDSAKATHSPRRESTD